jgi:hypothetical protein
MLDCPLVVTNQLRFLDEGNRELPKGEIIFGRVLLLDGPATGQHSSVTDIRAASQYSVRAQHILYRHNMFRTSKNLLDSSRNV